MALTALIIAIVLVALMGGIWLAVLAFQESVLWGLAVLFIPFGKLAFVSTRWEETKTPFLISLCASVTLFGIVFAERSILKDHRTSHRPMSMDSGVLASAGQTTYDGGSLVARRSAYARNEANLKAQYAQLMNQHDAIRPGTSDVSVYNVNLLHYNEAIQALHAEKARLSTAYRQSNP